MQFKPQHSEPEYYNNWTKIKSFSSLWYFLLIYFKNRWKNINFPLYLIIKVNELYDKR